MDAIATKSIHVIGKGYVEKTTHVPEVQSRGHKKLYIRNQLYREVKPEISPSSRSGSPVERLSSPSSRSVSPFEQLDSPSSRLVSPIKSLSDSQGKFTRRFERTETFDGWDEGVLRSFPVSAEKFYEHYRALKPRDVRFLPEKSWGRSKELVPTASSGMDSLSIILDYHRPSSPSSDGQRFFAVNHPTSGPRFIFDASGYRGFYPVRSYAEAPLKDQVVVQYHEKRLDSDEFMRQAISPISPHA